ncbi:MAG TPA: hypothetical protein ENK18_12530 [Deltaproteobacteria bacterium]|nr:hypothetical protein [Deltaproteobacteria bacterium]
MHASTFVIATLVACRGPGTPGDKPGPGGSGETGISFDSTLPTADSAPTPPGTGDPAALSLPAPQPVDNGRFATADSCALCHDGAPGSNTMVDEVGNNIAPHDLWRSSMMANAARDPLWRAVMSAEIAATPAAADAIGQKCTRCHAPLASGDATLTGASLPTADVLTDGDEATFLALDGVSCTACHQIEDIGLGEEASASGGWTILGQGRIYGPHAEPFDHPMSMHGFTPLQSAHITDSGLCATCHTLTTHALAEDGSETGGTVLEQGPYLEWLNSDHVATSSCQGCHLPTVSAAGVPITTRIAHNPMGMAFPQTPPRSPFGRHLLVGANTLIPAILRDWPDVLRPGAPASAFDATLAAARDQLARQTATVQIGGVDLTADTLSFDVDLRSMTGHKLPTGIPLRRLWLHATVTDALGTIVFESGASDDSGRLVDSDGVALPSEAVGGPVLPHLDAVSSGDEVAVYEAILADGSGAPTFQLLRAAGFVKDNRLLPTGWDPTVAVVDGTAAVGVAGDPDFTGGSDTVHYTAEVANHSGPLTIEIEALYQPLAARWAAELFASGTPEALGFQAMYEAAERGPERVATDTAVVP